MLHFLLVVLLTPFGMFRFVFFFFFFARVNCAFLVPFTQMHAPRSIRNTKHRFGWTHEAQPVGIILF
uniref:Putative secreted protein n=1 Tax=Anopheles darlingi TaxID=43151 RepID=A0A2M4DE02_ANODA